MLNRLAWMPGDVLLSLKYDLSLYAFAAAAAALLVFLVLFRRKAFGRSLAAVVVAVFLVAVGAVHWLRASIQDPVGSARLEVLSAMQRRPADPWPRATAHVPLGRIGSPESEKGYLEPGGSFSPSPWSFGVSFWVVDRNGELIVTSDDIPLDQTHATYEVSVSGEPAIRVETPYYIATWTAKDNGSFDLALAGSEETERSVDIVFRGVGPAAGPLTKIEFKSGVLHLNTEWSAGTFAQNQLIYIGEEENSDWKRPNKTLQRTLFESANGWAIARFSLRNVSVNLTLQNTRRQIAPNSAVLPHLRFPITVHGSDSRFAASLNAQIMTLGLGLVRDETRPGEPLNYPLEWLRDGAYVVVALARGGQHEIATRLALAAAPKDFFGGFGAEADAPGLGLWMLTETAAVVRIPDFDRAIWPHVARKVRLLQEMLHTERPIKHDFVGPVVPAHSADPDLTAVADPPRNGLINGRMDGHKPLFFVNAVSYAGLTGAVHVAERLGEDLGKEWRQAAADLKQSWNQAFVDPTMSEDAENERTAISALWPSSVAEKSSFEKFMDQRWQHQSFDSTYDPPWTYFSIAEAHQWLELDKTDRVWAILNHFWSKQPFPGLYTLWEGRGEENSFGLWQSVRGWVSPPNVNPHYWAAAEMLLLQLAMLAEVRGEGPTEELVIGAGIPPEWLSRDLLFRGVGTSIGAVDWMWDGNNVFVTLAAPRSLPIRLGSSFPASATIQVIR